LNTVEGYLPPNSTDSSNSTSAVVRVEPDSGVVKFGSVLSMQIDKWNTSIPNARYAFAYRLPSSPDGGEGGLIFLNDRPLAEPTINVNVLPPGNLTLLAYVVLA
jgi:hypothetical protein